MSWIFCFTLGIIACLLKPEANDKSWFLDVGLWLKKLWKWTSFDFLEKATFLQVKYKPWAQHAWVSASPIHYGASRGLVYTQKDQLAIKNQQTKLPKPRVHISYSEYEKIFYITLVENCFKLYFFAGTVLASRLSKRYVKKLCFQAQNQGYMVLYLQNWYGFLVENLSEHSQQITNQSFINTYMDSSCNVTINWQY